MIDVLVYVALAFFLFKLYRRRRGRPLSPTAMRLTSALALAILALAALVNTGGSMVGGIAALTALAAAVVIAFLAWRGRKRRSLR